MNSKPKVLLNGLSSLTDTGLSLFMFDCDHCLENGNLVPLLLWGM